MEASSSKKKLELVISRMPRYRNPKRRLEQYQTPSSIVAHLAWTALMRGDLDDSTILDLGCGDGRLAIAALLLGAMRAICVDVDEDILVHGLYAISSLFPWIATRIIYVESDAVGFTARNVDTVVMNPPFGVVRGNKGLDIAFLKTAMRVARAVYSIHKYSPGLVNMLYELAESSGFKLCSHEVVDFEIPMMYETHKRQVYRVKSVIVILVEKGEVSEQRGISATRRRASC
ncbi:MAG: 50S ribosomal protein L11 methyltransferase [Desulfurococcus sp.]|nr:50S ribosomal protein L11 methyltransferase [Desulfurococcus sp.]